MDTLRDLFLQLERRLGAPLPHELRARYTLLYGSGLDQVAPGSSLAELASRLDEDVESGPLLPLSRALDELDSIDRLRAIDEDAAHLPPLLPLLPREGRTHFVLLLEASSDLPAGTVAMLETDTLELSPMTTLGELLELH